MSLIPWQIRAALVAALLLAGGAGIAWWNHHERDIGRKEAAAMWSAAVDRLKADAARTLLAEQQKTLAAERRLHESRAQQEKTDANNQSTVDGLRRELASLRLRDPYASGRWSGGGGPEGATSPAADAGGADEAGSAGVLSEKFTSMLLNWAARADEINNAYASCRAHIQSIMGQDSQDR